MKYKTIIVDDEEDARKLLELYVRKSPNIDLLSVCKNGNEALEAIQTYQPSIVFLDIQMPEVNGIQVAEQCPHPQPYFVFVTAFDQYAVDAFERNAIDYILKPYSQNRIEVAIEKAISSLERDDLANRAKQLSDLIAAINKGDLVTPNTSYLERIAIKGIGKTEFINIDDVIHISAADQYVEVFTSNHKHIVRESMDRLEQLLDPAVFFRTHRSHIVRLSKVKSTEVLDKNNSAIRLENGMLVKLSNSRKQTFKEIMNIQN